MIPLDKLYTFKTMLEIKLTNSELYELLRLTRIQFGGVNSDTMKKAGLEKYFDIDTLEAVEEIRPIDIESVEIVIKYIGNEHIGTLRVHLKGEE